MPFIDHKGLDQISREELEKNNKYDLTVRENSVLVKNLGTS